MAERRIHIRQSTNPTPATIAIDVPIKIASSGRSRTKCDKVRPAL
jgi:hypothetical protein